MSTQFYLTNAGKPDVFTDTQTVADIKAYAFNCTAWEQDNGTITSATWTIKSGEATITNTAVSSGSVSGNITIANEGKALISVRLNTSSVTKTIWLLISAIDMTINSYDYA